MKKFLASFVWISLVLVMASCSLEQRCYEGECEPPEGHEAAEEKH